MSAQTLTKTSPRHRTPLETARRAEHIAAIFEGHRARRRVIGLLTARNAA